MEHFFIDARVSDMHFLLRKLSLCTLQTGLAEPASRFWSTMEKDYLIGQSSIVLGHCEHAGHSVGNYFFNTTNTRGYDAKLIRHRLDQGYWNPFANARK